MKVGKKALSCLLAIIMIVSSCSVCFSVLGATTDTADIYSAIVMHHDSLMDAIDKATKGPEDKRDPSGVPVKNGSVWEVKRDTLNGGWLAVSRAVAQYAKGTVGTNKTYVDLVEKIKVDAQGYATANGHKVTDYNAILDYYKFGSTATGTFATQETVTLNIGTGFDLLAFKDVAAIEDKTYSTAVLKFTPKGGDGVYTLSTADDISFKAENFIDDGEDLAAIKSTLEQCIDANAFKAWFQKETLSSTELNAMSNLWALFRNTFAITGLGYTEAEVWDHFVAPATGKYYAQTAVWVENSGARAEAEPIAAQYKADLNALMAKDTSTMDVFALLAHRGDIEAKINALNNENALVLEIINEDENFIGKDGYKVEAYLKGLDVEIGKAYAALYFVATIYGLGNNFNVIDGLVDLAARAENLKLSADLTENMTAEELENFKWEETAEFATAKAWLTEATEVVRLFDDYVLAYASFADLVDIVTSMGNSITEEIYNKVDEKIALVSRDVYGKSYLEDKASMDTMIEKTILAGRNFKTVYELYTEYMASYNKALALSTDAALADIYAEIYPDGIDKYTDYIHTLKAQAALSYYEALSVVDKYYSEAGAVAYFNFESIIAKVEAIKSSAGIYTTVAEFLDADPVYIADKTKDEISTTDIFNLANKVFGADGSNGYYKQALDFKAGLNALRQQAYNDSDSLTADKKILAYIIGNEKVSGYAWASCLGGLNVYDIQSYVNDIQLVQHPNVNVAGIKTLMNNAVYDLDRILVSNDLGTLLNDLTGQYNEETGKVEGFLGTWEYNYTIPAFTDSDGVRHEKESFTAGQPCKNLREFLINLIVGLLWGGSLQTTLFTALNGAVGPAVYNIADTNGEPLSLVSASKSLWQWLPEITQRALPTMPHLYYEDYLVNQVDKVDGQNHEWYKYFTGAAFGKDGDPEYDYTTILRVLQKAPIDKSVYNQSQSSGNTELRSYWAPFTYGSADRSKNLIATKDTALLGTYNRTLPYDDGSQITASMALDANLWKDGKPEQTPYLCNDANCTNKDHYFSNKKAWHVNDWSDFYRTFAVATCGLHVPLAELLTKKGDSNLFAEADLADINASVIVRDDGDSLYDRLFIPLYRLLGIDNFHSGAEIISVAGTYSEKNNMGVNVSSIYNSGADLWQYVLEPIITWLQQELFLHPVRTIAELLPNLLAMLEYDQLIPKLSNILLYIGYDVWGIVKGNVTTLSLTDIVLPLLEGLGINQQAMSGGITGLLTALLGGKRVTNPVKSYTVTNSDGTTSTVDYKYLMKVEKKLKTDPETGLEYTETVTSDTEKATWVVDGKTYYIQSPGLLTSALYSAMMKVDDPKTPENENLNNAFLEWMFMKGGDNAQVPLTIPVNRFMSTGSVVTKTSSGAYSATITNYHINA